MQMQPPALVLQLMHEGIFFSMPSSMTTIVHGHRVIFFAAILALTVFYQYRLISVSKMGEIFQGQTFRQGPKQN